jgi:hypothetical protein
MKSKLEKAFRIF